MPLFYILAFYFYMKRRRLLFFISYLLLLSVIEAAPFIGASLLVGLLLYERFYASNRDPAKSKQSGYRLLLYATILTLLSASAYYYLGGLLFSSYSSTPYATISPLLWYFNTPSLLSQSQLVNGASQSALVYPLALVGLLVLLLGLGLSTLADPIISLVLLSPWIFLAFLYQLHGTESSSFYCQYYAYALGGAAVAVILGFLIVMEHKPRLALLAKHLNPLKNEQFLFAQMIVLSILLLLSLSPLPFSVLVQSTYNSANLTALNTAVSIIPANASVMAETIFAPHLFYVHNLELLAAPSNNTLTPYADINGAVYWFKPDYILYAENFSDYYPILYGPIGQAVSQVSNYTRYNYTRIYNVSGIVVLKHTR